MGAVFGLMQGMALPYVSLMMALPPIGVIVTQFPAGALSDRYDRRTRDHGVQCCFRRGRARCDHRRRLVALSS